MKRLLLVDDNKMNQLVAAATLERLGYVADIVNDGFDAIAAAKSRKYDAILMDVQMPGMDGYDATDWIRQHEASCALDRTPIIGLSARAMLSDREAAIAAGMDDYLTKPLRREELVVALERVLAPAVDSE